MKRSLEVFQASRARRNPHQGMLAAGSAYHAAPLLLPILASTAGDAYVLPYAAADALSALALAGLVHALRKQGLAPAFPGAFPGANDLVYTFTGKYVNIPPKWRELGQHCPSSCWALRQVSCRKAQPGSLFAILACGTNASAALCAEPLHSPALCQPAT